MSRPLGIKIIAGLQFFLSGLGLVVNLSVLIGSSAMLQVQKSLGFLSVPIWSICVAGIVFSLIWIRAGYGLLKLEGWAWIYTIVVQIISVLSSLPNVSSSLQSIISASKIPVPLVILIVMFVINLIFLILPLVIIRYLCKQDIKQAFFQKKVA
jgi:hypothetical protein